MKILVTDGMDKTALEQLKQNGHEVTEQFYPRRAGRSPEGIRRRGGA